MFVSIKVKFEVVRVCINCFLKMKTSKRITVIGMFVGFCCVLINLRAGIVPIKDRVDGPSVPTTCTVTYTCTDLLGTPNGSVSCTGTSCKRGTETEGVIFKETRKYVECDGKKTYC